MTNAVSNEVTNAPLTAEQMKARLESEKAEELKKAMEALDKKYAKKEEKLDEDLQEQALAAKSEELLQNTQEFYRGIVPALGIVIPEKGLKFNHQITITRGPNDTLLVSVEKPARKVATSGDGTPRTRTAGTGGRKSMTQIANITGFTVNGNDHKSASAALKALVAAGDETADFGSDNSARFMVAWAMNHKDAANEVIVKFADGSEAFLADVVESNFGTSAPAPVAPTPPAIPTPPAPPAPVTA